MRPENDPSGQPRSFIEAARRRQIIAAAVDVLADAGFTGASLARIAEHAGVSKGVISYHFDGKDDLLREVVVSLYRDGAEWMTPRIAAEPTALGRVRAYLASNLDFLAAQRRHVAAMIEVVFGLRDRAGRPVFSAADGDNAAVAPLAELLADGQRTGELGAFDPWILAQQIRDSIDGAANRAARDAELDLGPYADQLIDIYLRAVRPTPQSPTDRR